MIYQKSFYYDDLAITVNRTNLLDAESTTTVTRLDDVLAVSKITEVPNKLDDQTRYKPRLAFLVKFTEDYVTFVPGYLDQDPQDIKDALPNLRSFLETRGVANSMFSQNIVGAIDGSL